MLFKLLFLFLLLGFSFGLDEISAKNKPTEPLASSVVLLSKRSDAQEKKPAGENKTEEATRGDRLKRQYGGPIITSSYYQPFSYSYSNPYSYGYRSSGYGYGYGYGYGRYRGTILGMVEDRIVIQMDWLLSES